MPRQATRPTFLTELMNLEPAPLCEPGDTEMARAYLRDLETVFETKRDRLTHPQYNRVQKAIKRWRKRAAGMDARFNLVGNAPGRQTFDVEWQIWKMQRAIDGTDATEGD